MGKQMNTSVQKSEIVFGPNSCWVLSREIERSIMNNVLCFLGMKVLCIKNNAGLFPDYTKSFAGRVHATTLCHNYN